MIDAAREALSEGRIDTYRMELAAASYRVTITAGGKTGEGLGVNEEDAYAVAQDQLKSDSRKKGASKGETAAGG